MTNSTHFIDHLSPVFNNLDSGYTSPWRRTYRCLFSSSYISRICTSGVGHPESQYWTSPCPRCSIPCSWSIPIPIPTGSILWDPISKPDEWIFRSFICTGFLIYFNSTTLAFYLLFFVSEISILILMLSDCYPWLSLYRYISMLSNFF